MSSIFSFLVVKKILNLFPLIAKDIAKKKEKHEIFLKVNLKGKYA